MIFTQKSIYRANGQPRKAGIHEVRVDSWRDMITYIKKNQMKAIRSADGNITMDLKLNIHEDYIKNFTMPNFYKK